MPTDICETETGCDPVKRWAYALLFPMIPAVAVSISLFVALSCIFIGLVLISAARSKSKPILKDFFFWLLLLYFSMNVLSLTQTHFWCESSRGVLKIFRQVILCAGIAYTLDTPEKIKKLYPWFFLTAGVLVLDSIFQGGTGRDLFNDRKMTAYFGVHGRLTGPFKHANDFSAYLGVLGILFLGVMLDGLRFLSKKIYFFYAIGFAMVLGALLGTYSRTGWFAFLIVAFLMAALRKNKVFLGALLALVVWGILFSPPLVQLRIRSIWDPHGGTVSERSQLWAEAIQMVKARPLLGLGANTYAKNEPAYKSAPSDYQYAHNGYLQIAAEIGLLGLASFLAVMIYFLVVSFKVFLGRRSLEPALQCAGISLSFAVLGFLIHSAFDTDLQSILLVNLLWMIVGFSWAVRKLAAKP